MKNFVILTDSTEHGVRSTTLGAERPISEPMLCQFLDLIPHSHLQYAFTMKENRNSMLPYLKQDSFYYMKLLTQLFQLNKNFRICVYIEEHDSRNTRHVHGVVSTHKRIRYKNAQIPGMQMYFTKLKKPLKNLTADEIMAGGPIINCDTIPTGERSPPPTYWRRYILKCETKYINTIIRVSMKNKILVDNTKKKNGIPKEI